MFLHKNGPETAKHPWFTPLISAFMISFLAWPRAIIFTLLLTTLAEAREESLFTSSVTYCSPPETLLIQRFEVAYFPSNSSVSFNVSASSVEANVNVTANIFFNVYGMKPFNVTIDLCNILKGVLCPLPMYNFTGADSLQLPSSLNIAQKIPNIAFRIPDLEGFAQLTLTEVHTGKVKACVQATLTNGWSTHQGAVSWTTAMLALLTFLAAGAFSISSPKSILPFRFLELIYLYQSIATSTLLNLNYPSIYRAFALNFAWALGLISSADSPVQSAITRMRHLTGGQISDISAGDAVGFVNRNLSPYNNIASKLRSAVIYSMQAIARETIKGEVQIVTANSPTVLQAGVPIFVNLLGIATANAFMTIFIVTFCLLAISLVVVALGYAVLLVIRRRQFKVSRGTQPPDFDYLSFVISWYFRMALGLATPLLIFIFYQWTLKDSWLAVFLSIITLLIISAAIIYPSFRTFQLARSDSPSALFHPSHHLSRFSSLYGQYRQERYWFFTPMLAAVFLRSILIAFAKHSGPAQLAFMIIVEAGLVLSHFVLKPSWSRGSHVFSTYLAVTRFVCTVMMIAFLQKLQVMAIPRVVIGIVMALIWLASILVVIANVVWNIVLSVRQPSRSVISQDVTTPSQPSMVEKGHGDSISSQEKSQTGSNSASPSSCEHDDEGETQQASNSRPKNPTPEHNIPLDPAVIQPHSFSPTETIVSNSDPLTTSPSSRTTTYGSELPTRWSVDDSQPTSPMASSQGHSTGQGSKNPATSSSETGENPVGGIISDVSTVENQQRCEDIHHDGPRR